MLINHAINSKCLVNGEQIDDFKTEMDQQLRYRHLLDSIDWSLNSVMKLCMNI